MKRRWLGILLAIALFAAAAAVHSLWLPLLATWLDVSRRPQFADYAMVMGGGIENRPVVAAFLWKKGWVKQILISEIRPRDPEARALLPPEHELTRAMLVRLGVPDDRIVTLPGNHAATFHEIESLRRLLKEHPKCRVLIVTDALHTRRTAWSVHHLLGPDARRVGFVSTPSERYELSRWWQTADGFFMVTSEYLKLFFYVLRYGQGALWLGGAVAIAAALVILLRIFRRLTEARPPAGEVGRAVTEI